MFAFATRNVQSMYEYVTNIIFVHDFLMTAVSTHHVADSLFTSFRAKSTFGIGETTPDIDRSSWPPSKLEMGLY